MLFISTFSLKEAVVLPTVTTNRTISTQARSVFPMAKPCYRFMLKRRWKKWHKRNNSAA